MSESSKEFISNKITIYAYARDAFDVFVKLDGEYKLDHSGYLPQFLVDYFETGNEDNFNITIDLKTGKVVGWDCEKFLKMFNEHLQKKDKKNSEE